MKKTLIAIVTILLFNLIYSQDTTNLDTVQIIQTIEQLNNNKVEDLTNFKLGLIDFWLDF